MVPTIEVSNLLVEIAFQGQGNSKKFYVSIEKEADKRNLYLYVENSLVPGMVKRHRQAGYTEIESDPPCFFRAPRKDHE